MQHPITQEQAQEALNAYAANENSKTLASKAVGTSVSSIRRRLDVARELGLSPIGVQSVEDQLVGAKDEIRTLRASLKAVQSEELTRDAIKEKIFGLSTETPDPPKWLLKPRGPKDSLGVPTLFLSDWHWGEVVNPSEIGGCNKFNLEIAHERVKKVVETAISLLYHHMAKAHYDGLVLPLGGDMITGDIHEELTNTNAVPVIPAVLDLYGVLIWVINEFLKHFEHIYIPCVTGNHGRNTKKIQNKERAATSFDWMLYCLLQKHFEGNKNVQFDIPDGPDCSYKIYNHRYLLTHGDQFRGGNGIAGVLMPIERGRHKKSTRNSALNNPFDTMIIGHFHQLVQLQHLIVNSCLKGYDEYAFNNNFSFEEPSQAMWITHPERGITIQMPIYCDEPAENEESPWVSWTE